MRFIKIPLERVGVLVGKDGEIKKRIEDETGTTLNIDSENGDVTIDDTKSQDPILSLKCADMVKAIGRGFSPTKAFRLLNDEVYFTLLDMRDFVGKNQKHVRRIRARVIGTKGKTRRLIEELTGVNVSIYGNTIGVIGENIEISVAVTAIEMLLSGSEHSAVYGFLEKKRKDIELSEMGF
ncbi:MAG: RNA-processing protein [Thermoplasmata archaeon]|nr:MAG: RNA-processing protein [Thermoplasmata archaeon]